MNSKLQIPIAVLQIIVGILGLAVCIRNTIIGGDIEMTVVAILLAVLGLANGIRGIAKK